MVQLTEDAPCVVPDRAKAMPGTSQGRLISEVSILLAAGFAVGTTTAWRYVSETVALLAAG